MAIKDRTQLEIWNFWGTHNRTSHFIKKKRYLSSVNYQIPPDLLAISKFRIPMVSQLARSSSNAGWTSRRLAGKKLDGVI